MNIEQLRAIPEHVAIVSTEGSHAIFQKRKGDKWIAAHPGAVQTTSEGLMEGPYRGRFRVIYRPPMNRFTVVDQVTGEQMFPLRDPFDFDAAVSACAGLNSEPGAGGRYNVLRDGERIPIDDPIWSS
jgi:hypothetical protein